MELARIERLAGIGTFRIEWTSGRAQWTAAAADLLGLAADDGTKASATLLFSTIHEEDRAAFHEALQSMIVNGGSMNHQARVMRGADQEVVIKFGCEVTTENESGKVMILGTMRDVTSGEQQDARLRRLVCYDGLTGLPTRVLFREQIGFAARRAVRERDLVAVLSLEIDNLRGICDSLGHDVGDALVKATSQRISRCVRGEDVVAASDGSQRESSLARFSGSSFGVLLSRIREPQDASRVTERIQQALDEPFMVEGHELYPTIQMGVAIWPWDSEDAEGLLRCSDTALGQTKLPGSSRVQFYSRSVGMQAAERLALETGMRRALEREEFTLYFQPRVDGASGRLMCMEGLARWEHPEKGLIPPDEFIPIAEQNRFIIPLGEWLLEEGCRFMQRWRIKALDLVPLSINVSAVQFRNPNFVNMVKRALETTELPPKFLEIELTESVLMQNADSAVAILKRLKALGVRVSIDDFGTGYSSLNYLRNLEVDALKIDRGFVSNLPGDRKNAAITCAIIDLARRLSIHVVGEGVETPEQRRFLLNNGCAEMQGYLFAKPLPAEQAEMVLRAKGFDLSALSANPSPAPAAPVATPRPNPLEQAFQADQRARTRSLV